jgi:hypothetical protein
MQRPMSNGMVTFVVAPIIAFMAGMAGRPLPTRVTARAEMLTVSRLSEAPRPLPTCAEAGAYFCDTLNPDWDYYESDINVWFPGACHSETHGCETKVL